MDDISGKATPDKPVGHYQESQGILFLTVDLKQNR